jgi:phage-related protein
MKRLGARFYQLPSGREPVRAWLRTLSDSDRKTIGGDIRDVEFAWPIGLPLCRSLGRGIWEVRSNLDGGRIARVLFSVQGDQMILLNGFIKKTQKTPEAELTLALKRMRSL